jgi:CubicO group peptidase (beta-lactamase class C family)
VRIAVGLTLVAFVAGCTTPLHTSSSGSDAVLDSLLAGAVGEKDYLGAVAMVSLKDVIVYHGALGHADATGKEPLREDAIFRIYSMTKPITSVAALMLVEEGRLRLDDPVARYLPGFAGLQRVAGGDEAEPQLMAVYRPLTVRHLLTHTAGFATGGDDIRVASALLQQQAPEDAEDLADYARRVACAPLADEPGTRFRYDGVNSEVLARVIEVASGTPLDVFLQSRIFAPLGMRDTGFQVPASQRGRIMALTTRNAEGHRVLADTPSAREPGIPLRAYRSGAGGLYSTAADYLRFARMLANGGELDGIRLLQPSTVDQMMQDQLVRFDPPVAYPEAGEGFGLGGYVVTDTAKTTRPGSQGQFGWSGAASTWFTIDRSRRLVIVLMSQHLPTDGAPALPKIAAPFYRQVYSTVSP